MAHLNHRGPEEKGPKTGRMLGKCKKTDEEKTWSAVYQLGKGMGRKKRKGCNKETGSRSRASDILN